VGIAAAVVRSSGLPVEGVIVKDEEEEFHSV
jgi:hypothetical protein